MSKRKTSYPLDEFDPQPGANARNGVHRSPKSPWSAIWPYLVALVVAAALGLGTIYALMQSPDSKVNSIINEATKTPSTETPKPSDEETTASESPEPEESTEPKEEPSPETSATEDEAEETPEPELTVDRSVSVRVLNAGTQQGAAATAASKVTADGFTRVEAANFEGQKPSSAVIYYRGVENRATAERVGELVGISNLTEVESLRADISVVLR